MANVILAVSVGTAYPDALALAVAPTEKALASACPGWELRRAFTSDTIRQRMQRNGLVIDGVSQAMERLAAEEVTQVAVQPIYVTQGAEYERMRSQVEPYRRQLRIAVGTPLLYAEADFRAVADALLEWLPPLEEDEALILMGHGGEGSGNAAYARLEQVLHARCGRIYVAALKGEPALEDVKRQLAKRPEIRKLMLAPFLVAAGGHARKDMAGGEGSWESALKAAGYPVRCVFQGLGQCPRIRELFAAHCRQAVEALERIVQEGGNP